MRLIKTVNPDINIVTDPTYKNENINELLFKLQKNNNTKLSTKLMKDFLSQDLKINLKFSIIIATLNNENTIKRNLESIKSQSFTDYEIIIVDGAPDKLYRLLKVLI